MMDVKQGVYIGKDIEVVVTEKYTLIFVAKDGMLMTFLAQSPDCRCIHVVKTELVRDGLGVEYLLTRQGGMNYVKGQNLLKYKGQRVAEITWKDGGLSCNINFLDGSFSAEADECLEGESLFPQKMEASADNIAQCLNRWHLGVHEIVENWGNKSFFCGVIVNTPKHMYLYQAREGGRIYIRAARYRCVGKGVAFNQNFRQFYGAYCPGDAHHVVARDNRMAMEELEVNEEFFVPGTCCLDNNTFYWSVKNYTSNMITLNGCGGEEYHWRPGKGAVD